MQMYFIECFKCDMETQVALYDNEEPCFCPMCGSEVNAQLIEEEDDSEEE